MPLLPLEYLRHIIDETEYLIADSQELSKDGFMGSETLKWAFVRSHAGNTGGSHFWKWKNS
jgi:hypothetical protein